MSSQYYLDYNATAPINKRFLKDLAADLIPFANSSSQHTLGKKAAHYIEQVKDYLFSYFAIPKGEFDILFHSGATEASNTFLATESVIAHKSDHSCVTKLDNKNLKLLPINKDGSLDENLVIEELKKLTDPVLHFTAMHSETGIVWPLEQALKIKEATNCRVYVDYVQPPGKIEYFQKLLPDLDYYTLSGHKFGAMKGIGFTFFKKELKPKTLIHGGGQQNNLRSGTVNITGIASLKYALEDLTFEENVGKLKNEIEDLLNQKTSIELIKNDSNNTICFLHEKQSADMMLIHFDLAGLAVSSGSACSSGSLKESQTLLAMGRGEKAKNNIRISLGPENIKQQKEILDKIQTVVAKL